MIFGSELKIILSNPVYRKEIDAEAMNTFLTFRYNPAPQTLFKGIRKLNPAHYLEYTISGGRTSLNPYWISKPVINMRISETEAVEEYKHLLQNAVKRQLLSDVPRDDVQRRPGAKGHQDAQAVAIVLVGLRGGTSCT